MNKINDPKTKLNAKGGDSMTWVDVTKDYYKRQKGKKAVHLQSRYEEIYISKPTDIDWMNHMYTEDELVVNIVGKTRVPAKFYKGAKGTTIYFKASNKSYRVFVGDIGYIYIHIHNKTIKKPTEYKQLSLFDGELQSSSSTLNNNEERRIKLMKNTKNKKYRADKFYWYFTNEGDWAFGPDHYIITNQGAYEFSDTKLSAKEFIKFLIGEGYKPCTYISMYRVVEKYNERLKKELNIKLQELYMCGSHDDIQEYKIQYKEDYNAKLLHTKGLKARCNKRFKISE
ncbi:MAG: hypothetical protein MJ191_00215 [Clostridium sp.]|nr:hypothetical protein [Clostridium sp.]